MIKKINCKNYNDYGHCKVRFQKVFGFLWYVKSPCEEYHTFGQTCTDALRHPRPVAPPPPPSPPPVRVIIEGVRILDREEREQRREND